MFAKLLTPPALTPWRVRIAYASAVSGDLVQLALGPLGWVWVDQGIDVAVMLVVMPAIGFHPLLLPTFVLELIPMADMLPTWTACVALVIKLRRIKEARVEITVSPSPSPGAGGNDPPLLPRG